VNTFANPSGFITIPIHNEVIIEVVSTLQLTQTPCLVESKVEIIFDICRQE